MKTKVSNINNKKGFTLIELLIVVVILGVLAAVVIPQLSGATDDAKTESLKTNLSNIRTAIEMYEYEHSAYPGVTSAGTGATCNTTGSEGTGNVDSKEAFAAQLTMYTNASGGTCSVSDTTTYVYGPYLKTTELGEAGFPVNSVTNSKDIALVTTGSLTLVSTIAGGGWRFDNVSGKFIADDPAYDHH